MQVPDYFVLFADMLGFTRLVLDNQVPLPQNLEFRSRPVVRQTIASMTNLGNPLSEGFRAFHGSIENVLAQSAWKDPAHLVVFSDSMFLATLHGGECLSFAEELMRQCISNHTPLRMGIGRGSFVPYGFAFQETPTLKYMSSQFFGSGVIYATCGERAVTGMRIALHRTAADSILETVEPYSCKILKLPRGDSTDESITHEWNYLGNWADHPDDAEEDTSLGEASDIGVDIRQMHRRAPDIPRVQQQYVKSEEAVDRMAGAVEDFLAFRKAMHSD